MIAELEDVVEVEDDDRRRITPQGAWVDESACAGYPPDWFDAPVLGGSDSETVLQRQRSAAYLCGPCPVRDACRQDALDNELEGIWGGVLFRNIRLGGHAHAHRPLADLVGLLEAGELDRPIIRNAPQRRRAA